MKDTIWKHSTFNTHVDSPTEVVSASWSKSCFSWVILLGWIGLLTGCSLWNPWLKLRLDSIPPIYIGMWGIVIGCALLSSRFSDGIWCGYKNQCQKIFTRIDRHPWLAGFLIITLSAGLFGYFRIQRVDAGDILEWVMAGKQGKAFLVEHAPLETLVRCWLAELLSIWPSLDLIPVYKTLVCFYGGLFVWVVLWFSSRMEKPASFLTPIFFFATSSMSVYFGYLEIYGATNLVQTIFLLTVFQYCNRKMSLTAVGFWYGMTVAVGFWHGILFPAYIYLVWRSRHTMRWVDWPLQGFLISVPSLLSLIGLIPYANPFAGIVTRLSEPSVLIPLSPFARSLGYTLWGKAHLADWASEILLIIPIPLVLLVTRGMCDIRQIKIRCRQTVFWFGSIACVSCFIFGFLYHPVLGFPLDWDLYTFMYPSFGFCGVVLMNDIERSRMWRKRLVVLALAAIALASCWILQNALFWRYPLLLTKVGPIVSPLISDFYYKNMQRAFERNNQANLYWLADRAMEESPEYYREILTFMDDWTVSTLTKLPALAFDYPGWACDVALMPGGVYRALVFDKWGRLFLYDGQTLKWIFAPDNPLDHPVVAGDVDSQGTAFFLDSRGQIYRVEKETIEQGIKEKVVWGKPTIAHQFLPESPSQRNLPVRMVDMAFRGSDGALCVVDNFNRVWDVATRTLLLQGEPSYNLVQSLHFNYNHLPVTIDVNDNLSYDRDKMKLPFPVAWFHPIVRDFLFTPDEKGLMVLDLNGNIHYMGASSIYKDIVQPGSIIDRYKKMVYLSGKDALLLLDNRYRLVEAGLDTDGSTTRQKISNMIDGGNFTASFNILSVLWKRSSTFTSICYDLLDTDVIRKIPGAVMYTPEDAISLYVDLLPIDDNLVVLLDRWGRLVALNKGVLFLLEGTGLLTWPLTEAIDGAYAEGCVYFLCRDGSIWKYEFQRFFGEQTSAFERSPSRVMNLLDFDENQQWIGIEPSNQGGELIAFSSSGILLRISIEEGRLVERNEIPMTGKPIFDFDYRDTQDGYAVAYTSMDGPAFLYSSLDQSIREAPNSNFGWPVISDIRFSRDENIVLLDRYGVIHQYDSVYRFSDKPYTTIMDALALRFLPSGDHALWMRSNGEIRTLRIKDL